MPPDVHSSVLIMWFQQRAHVNPGNPSKSPAKGNVCKKAKCFLRLGRQAAAGRSGGTMRLTMKAFVVLTTCLSVHTYALPDIQVPHIAFPQVQKS